MNNHTHPGEHLAEFISEYNLTVYRVAKDINVPNTRIDQITKGKRGISVDTAARLGKYFGTTPQFWLNLQANYELAAVSQSEIEGIKTVAA